MQGYQHIFSDYALDVLKTSRDSSHNPLELSLKFNVYHNELAYFEQKDPSKFENLAVELVKEEFPFLKENDSVIIKASLGWKKEDLEHYQSVMNIQSSKTSDRKLEIDDPRVKKRRIINSITQGAAFNTEELLKKHSDKISEARKEKLAGESYVAYMKICSNLYDLYEPSQFDYYPSPTENCLALERVYYSPVDSAWIIEAMSVNFTLLVHELVKGVYEFISYSGFTSDDLEENQKIANAENPQHEYSDVLVGKQVYSSLVTFIKEEYKKYTQSEATSEDILVVLQELYTLEPDVFIALVERVVVSYPLDSDYDTIYQIIGNITNV